MYQQSLSKKDREKDISEKGNPDLQEQYIKYTTESSEGKENENQKVMMLHVNQSKNAMLAPSLTRI